MDAPQTVRQKTQKSAWLFVAVILAISISGFFMGLRQTDSEVDRAGMISHAETEHDEDAPHKSDDDRMVVNATSYMDIQHADFRPNDHWPNDLSKLHSNLLSLNPSSDQRREQREDRRAYDGAPPVIPHPIDQHHAVSCMQCHGQATVIGERIAPAISHPTYTSCTQCHVSSKGLGSRWNSSDIDLHTGNRFSGYHQPQAGQRAYPDSPPTIPHTLHMRQNCLSCHGPQGTSPIQTNHPERQSCTQCHVPDFEVEASNFSESPFPLRKEVLKSEE